MSRLFIFGGILLVGILPRNILLRGIFLRRDFAGGIFLWRDLEGGIFQRRDFCLEGFSTPAIITYVHCNDVSRPRLLNLVESKTLELKIFRDLARLLKFCLCISISLNFVKIWTKVCSFCKSQTKVYLFFLNWRFY